MRAHAEPGPPFKSRLSRRVFDEAHVRHKYEGLTFGPTLGAARRRAADDRPPASTRTGAC